MGIQYIPSSPILATPSAAGAQSALDKAKQDTQAPGGWADLQALRMRAACPALSDFYAQKLGLYPNSNNVLPTGVTDAGRLGGALKYLNVIQPLTAILLPNPKAVPWSFVFRGRLGVPSSGQQTIVGWCDGGETKAMMGGFQLVLDATHMGFLTYDGGSVYEASAYVLDANERDYMLTYDLTKMYMHVDGAQVGSTATVAHIPTTPCALCVQAGTVTPVEIAQVAIGL